MDNGKTHYLKDQDGQLLLIRKSDEAVVGTWDGDLPKENRELILEYSNKLGSGDIHA